MLRRAVRCALALMLAGVMVLPSGCCRAGNGGTQPTPSDGTQPPSNGTTTTPSDGTTTTPPATTTVLVYFLDSTTEKVMPVRRTVTPPTVANAAMKELLLGPTPAEAQAGLVSTIPEGTGLRGVTITNRIATVDLSRAYESGGGSLSMMARVAQVVFTLTQFPTVDGVLFELEGKPLTVLGGEGIILEGPQTRSDWDGFWPTVLFDSPAFGDRVASPLRLYGTALVFEGIFFIDIVDGEGLVIATERVQVHSETEMRGTFDVTIAWTGAHSGRGEIVAWHVSLEDGSRVVDASVPVEF